MDKAGLRKEFLRKRESFSEGEAKQRSSQVISQLKDHPAYKEAHTLLIYVSKGKEVFTHGLIREALKEKSVCVPKMEGSILRCVRISQFSDLAPGSHGILEPEKGEEVDIRTIDLAVLPGLAFDREGYRLGYGLGYFDRLLEHHQGKKLGLAYGFQVIEKLPHDEWDVRMDDVIVDTPT